MLFIYFFRVMVLFVPIIFQCVIEETNKNGDIEESARLIDTGWSNMLSSQVTCYTKTFWVSIYEAKTVL